MTTLNEDLARALSIKTSLPVVLKDFVKNWKLCQWSEEKWCTVFGNKEIPFRTMNKDFISNEPCWERKCEVKSMTFKQFVNKIPTSSKWMYFDYKYLHQWFPNYTDLLKEVSWKQFGFPDKDASDTTLWVGSEGAHTAAHQDSYGCNIVAQLYGKKRWILFPPDTDGLRPTRVPYEESSVYSELNFYCPNDLEPFKGLNGGRSVELCAGDALVVPRGWWHYVQNLAPLNISLNIWLPHEKDGGTRVSEALIRILIAQICKDLPHETAKLIVNPNEDDLGDTPLAVLFLQLETVAKSYLDNRRKLRRAKRQKTREDDPDVKPTEEVDIGAILNNPSNKLEVVPNVSSDNIIDMLRNNLARYADRNRQLEEDETDGGTNRLCLTKAVIDAFSDPNVIELVKQNLFTRLS